MNEGETDRRVVDGRFELESRLGGGGMGTVWRARDLLLHRYVAVKEVRPPDIDLAEYDPGAAEMLRQRVLREARALARVEHPNVVTIHHIVDEGVGTYPWLVMELVQGGSLADRLARGPMAPAEAAQLGRGVLDALNAAHEAGVQHRDVKPANVLLRTDGRPVLTDFGIAAIRDATALTATGSIIGTPDYMAPERVSGQSGGPAADLWSLAMMLYVAVEGYHPLQRGTTLATLAAVLQEDVPPPVRAGSLTPVLSCVLVRDPESRPDAGTVGRMLDVAAAQPEDRRPETTSYRLAPPVPPPLPPTDGMQVTGSRRRPAKRNRGVTVASSVVGVLLVGTLAWKVLPDGNDKKDTSTSPGATATGQTHQTTPTVSASRSSAAVKTQDMLTPDGIRTAIKAFKEKTGSDRFADFSVYPGYVIAEVMVKGSETKYVSYTYRSGTGFDEGFDDKGTMIDGDKPVKLDDFNWDAVPALLTRAKKDLKVEKPTSRYLLLRSPSTNGGDTPAGMAIYLSDDYGSDGFLEANTQGTVTRVEPADG
ncbi:serine/threonine-protein kinase [Streptomyces sp. W16]|uniref:serine/threonine-protein kinase n=1 Tax=Streptomyces sp. W16 TaxID=3076631 RepID=UPI00295B5BF9|nr:serine/threonine-protein kinase [Streptomyces sp. W16]MDV9171160.1 serine/threonine-protein kinase [Streptomyces sp. W16]